MFNLDSDDEEDVIISPITKPVVNKQTISRDVPKNIIEKETITGGSVAEITEEEKLKKLKEKNVSIIKTEQSEKANKEMKTKLERFLNFQFR